MYTPVASLGLLQKSAALCAALGVSYGLVEIGAYACALRARLT